MRMTCLTLACTASLAGAVFAELPRTAGWGDGTAARVSIYPYDGIRWAGEGCNDSAFAVQKVGGAEGEVSVRDGIIRIVKTNDKGAIVVEGPSFAAGNGDKLRLAADVEVERSIGDSCHGFLRAHGRKPAYKVSELFENDFMGGGIPQSWGLPESPQGRTYRKYGTSVVKYGTVVAAIVVTGGASVSTWSNWVVMDMRTETLAWRKQIKPAAPKRREAERQDEAAFDADLAKDFQHTAKVVRENGVSCLYVDGKKANPVVYKGPHANVAEGEVPEFFAGGTLQGTGIPFAVKDIRLGKVPGCRGYWTKDGFDAVGAVREIKNAMRLAPTMPFVIAVGCNAYSEFVREEYPDEAMRRADGTVVLGTSGSCLTSYCMTEADKKRLWPWPSYSSRIWREGVKTCLRELVAELKRQGLDKRIVGIHTFGYHDGQFAAPFADHSPAAKAEYREYLKESGHASTNYAFFAFQTGLRAQAEFAREFKRALGKDAVGMMWSMNPLAGKRDAAYHLGEFLRSDSMDILVAQPSYVSRLPGLPGCSHQPTASFNLHGKLYFEELDFRTYASIQQWENSPSTALGLGTSEDFPMWQTVFRKNAGAMVAQRAGWWFYDMAGGWFSAPEIVDDIRTALKGYERVWTAKPSAWKPGVALVVDEAGPFGWPGEESTFLRQLNFSYKEQLYLLSRSGVPFDIYLAQDVLEDPTIVESYRMIVFGMMRKYDGSRIALVRRLSRKGRTLLHMARCGELGGMSEATGMTLRTNENADHVVVAEPHFNVEVNGLQYHDMIRKCDPMVFPPAHMSDWPRNSIVEDKSVRVLARYSDGAPAIAERREKNCRQVVFTEEGGISGAAFNRLAVEAGAYVPLPADVAQVEMNGDFVSVHVLRRGNYDFKLPFDCTVENLRSGRDEFVSGGAFPIRAEVGDTCQFLLRRK